MNWTKVTQCFLETFTVTMILQATSCRSGSVMGLSNAINCRPQTHIINYVARSGLH
jgi:hypothetical protein